MKFYARDKEIEILETQYQQTSNNSIMTVITGRRRIGKTSLAREYANEKDIFIFSSQRNQNDYFVKNLLKQSRMSFMFPYMEK